MIMLILGASLFIGANLFTAIICWAIAYRRGAISTLNSNATELERSSTALLKLKKTSGRLINENARLLAALRQSYGSNVRIHGSAHETTIKTGVQS